MGANKIKSIGSYSSRIMEIACLSSTIDMFLGEVQSSQFLATRYISEILSTPDRSRDFVSVVTEEKYVLYRDLDSKHLHYIDFSSSDNSRTQRVESIHNYIDRSDIEYADGIFIHLADWNKRDTQSYFTFGRMDEYPGLSIMRTAFYPNFFIYMDDYGKEYSFDRKLIAFMQYVVEIYFLSGGRHLSGQEVLVLEHSYYKILNELGEFSSIWMEFAKTLTGGVFVDKETLTGERLKKLLNDASRE